MPRAGNEPRPEGPGPRLGQKLQRDETVEPSVLGFVDHAHTAAAELVDDAVVRNGSADHGLADHLGDAWPSGRFILRTRPPLVNERRG